MAMTTAQRQALATSIVSRINLLRTSLTTGLTDFSISGTKTQNERNALGAQMETRANNLITDILTAEGELCALAATDASAYGMVNSEMTRALGAAYACRSVIIDLRRESTAAPVAHDAALARVNAALGSLMECKGVATTVVLQFTDITDKGFGSK